MTEAQLEGIASADLIVQTSAITSSSPGASTYSDGKRVTYRQCGSGTGAQIAYWDFQAGAAVVNTIGTGTC